MTLFVTTALVPVVVGVDVPNRLAGVVGTCIARPVAASTTVLVPVLLGVPDVVPLDVVPVVAGAETA